VLGLLIAFTFSGANRRFDARRQLIVEETNNIGTAYLRLDVLPADLRRVRGASGTTWISDRDLPEVPEWRPSVSPGPEHVEPR